MATYTNNLNLKKPESDDFYNVEDFNDNFDILDEEISSKADKMSSFVTGNLASLNSSGGLSDSGYSSASFLKSTVTYAEIGAEKSGEASKVQTNLTSHMSDTTSHLTSAEKTTLSKVFTTDDIVVSSTQPTAVEGRIWIKIS